MPRIARGRKVKLLEFDCDGGAHSVEPHKADEDTIGGREGIARGVFESRSLVGQLDSPSLVAMLGAPELSLLLAIGDGSNRP